MSWVDRSLASVRIKLAAAVLFAALAGGCQFQPMYADTSLIGSGSSLQQAMRDVDVAEINGRIGHELRNALIYELTGGAGNQTGAPYRLTLDARIAAVNPVIDRESGFAQAQILAFEITYKLHDVVQDRIVLTEHAMARVTADMSQQRFANLRARRDMEIRAAKLVADQMRSRIASYFLTRT